MIIGITGTLGAGKGTVVEYLKKEGFHHYSAREFIVREIKRRGLHVNRDAMTAVGNDLRAKHSPSYIAEGLYKEAQDAGGDAVIESLRTEGEVNALRKHKNFYLIALDADPKLRYERIISRASETDKISFEEFLHHEEREMHSTDPNNQNIARCIEIADYKIINNRSLADLHTQIDDILIKIRR